MVERVFKEISVMFPICCERIEGLVLRRIGRHNRVNCFYGQTLVEYGVCASAVLVVCIVAMQAMGGNLTEWLGLLKADMSKGVQKTAQVTAEQQAVLSAAKGAVEAVGQSGNVDKALETMQGTGVEENNATITVSGSNGSQTEAYATGILSQAKQSLDAGKLSKDEYNVILKMANKGHEIAQLQSLLEGAFQQSQGNSSAYASSNLNFNGQTYTPDQLNAVLDSNVRDFSALRSQASTQTGVLYDETLLSTIDNSGAQIINNGFSSMQQNLTAASFIQYQNEGGAGGSAETHQESATVCTAGSYQDSGTQCSK
jgi:hypothetical protein